MDKKEVETVFSILAEQMAIPVEEFKGTSSLVNDLGVDSLDQVEILLALEEEFNINIVEDDFMRARTVNDVITILDKIIKKRERTSK